MNKKRIITNMVLLVIAVIIAVFPLLVVKNSEFGGADDKATEMIEEINNNYKPWITSPWTPPGSETEGMLFALQAAIGAGVIFYCIGYLHGKSKKNQSKQ